MANAAEKGGESQVGTARAPKLLDRVRERIRYLHYSYRTEQAYVMWMRRFIYFHGKRHPQEMGGPEKFRPYRLPSADWLARAAAQLSRSAVLSPV